MRVKRDMMEQSNANGRSPMGSTADFIRSQRQSLAGIDTNQEAVWLTKYTAPKLGDTTKSAIVD